MSYGYLVISPEAQKLIEEGRARLEKANVVWNPGSGNTGVFEWAKFVEVDEDELKNISQAVEFALQNYTQPDVLVLGMGGDGHTASIFPKAPQFTDAICVNYPQPLLHTTPVTAPYERISMTLTAIVHTPYVYLAIAGADKLAIYQQAEQGENPNFPISYVLNKVHTNVFYND